MNSRPAHIALYRFTRLIWLAGFLFVTITFSGPAKPVLVHYMPWFVAKPFSGSWGWHWTMNHFNPDTTDGSGQRQIASWYYPLIGPYDSADPVVLEYHVLLLKLGGVDGVIADWYGQENYLDYGGINQRTLALLDYTRRAGLKFALCYEDRTVGTKVSNGYITASAAITNAQHTMLYAQTNYFAASNYLQFNQQPALFNFGPVYFKNNSQWQNIFSVLAADHQPAFFTEDNRLPVGTGAFDWPPMHLAVGGVLSPTALENYLANFQQKASAWPAFVSSAFPRFRDIYEQAGLGYTYGTLDDQNGLTFQSTLTRAWTNNSAMIQIVTWNDFGEGTVVEPTVEFGYRDLGVLQDFRRQFLDAGFPYRTNDLALATRLYTLRRQYPGNIVLGAELDRVFTNIVSGNLTLANLRLTGIESKLPVIYDLSATGGQLQFSIGGYVSASGIQVLTATNLTDANWQTAGSYPASADQTIFRAPLQFQATPTFFKVKTFNP